ncbi:sialate O-acetylesterase [bacterium]|nr:sialate O-acetylesterase [bacterium]
MRQPSATICQLLAGCLLPGLLLTGGGSTVRADVSLASIFSDHMVLQRDVEVPVWGTAAEGEEVTVQLGDQTAVCVASGGKWNVKLKPIAAGGPHVLSVRGKNALAVNDVLIGEVWICSGQSNMVWGLKDSFEPQSVIAGSADDGLRLITVPRVSKDEPQSAIDAKWEPAAPGSVEAFSAVGYYFGKHLRETLKVPVGLINTSFGGTPAEAWTSRERLESVPELAQSILGNYKQAIDLYPMALAKYKEDMNRWQEEANKAKAEGKPDPAAPRPPVDPSGNPQRPCGLYNAMIAPLIPFAIRGAIWYQGESNADRAQQYATLFPSMIQDWRTRWGQGEFPFFFVQLAPYTRIVKEPADSAWAELREAQRLTTLSLPNTAMAVITDVGEELDIHPRRKREVGERLALAARKLAYGENIPHSGPTFKELKIDGDKAIVHFDHVAGGLVAKDGPLTGFTLAGADGKFVIAQAEIVGDTVVLKAPEVPAPVHVRFGWANFPVVNLWNQAGLPASPFRTDQLPWITK